MDIKFDHDLPMKLKMLRLDAGLSQEEFAAKVGISRSCVANYETGKRQPDIHMIRKIAKVYGVITDVLIGNSSKAEMSFCETGHKNNNSKKSLPGYLRKTLDISHFPTENQISMFEYYDYMQAKHGKKVNPSLR